MSTNKKPNYDKNCSIFNFTYISGVQDKARTFRFQIGQQLDGIDACVYSITKSHTKVSNYFKEFYSVYIYAYSTNEILEYKTDINADYVTDVTNNIKYMIDNDEK
jgi:hypothetical protein